MKPQKLFIVILGAVFFSLAALPSIQQTQRITSGNEPYLPSVTYDYMNVDSPLFLINNPVSNTQYSPSPPSGGGGPAVNNRGATLGRVLFYDTQLSKNRTVSCASCHDSKLGFADKVDFSEGFDGDVTDRNSLGIVNAKFGRFSGFLWDRRANGMDDQIFLALESSIEMGLSKDTMVARLEATSFYPELFEDAFGSRQITAEKAANAITQFVISIVSFQSKYDHGRESVQQISDAFPNFTTEENLGKSLFLTHCSSCHTSDLFVMPSPQNNGLDLNYADKGVGEQTNNPGDYGMFAAASLRNIALTAPYMHDGRFETLEEVIEHYNSGVKNHPNLGAALRQNSLPNPSVPPRQLNLTQTQKNAMVAFLKTLTDTVPAHELKWSDPFDPANAPNGLSGIHNRLPMDVYPNPAQNVARVRFTNSEHQLFNIRVLDQNGRMISHDQTRLDNYQLNMGDLPAGVYMVEVFNDRQRQVEKLILK